MSNAAYFGAKPALSSATKAVAVADQAALTAAAAAGATPTKAEFDAVVADAVAARTKLNALLASLRTAGLLAP
jgi:hypothetical protein